jgi:hypothetical protein
MLLLRMLMRRMLKSAGETANLLAKQWLASEVCAFRSLFALVSFRWHGRMMYFVAHIGSALGVETGRNGSKKSRLVATSFGNKYFALKYIIQFELKNTLLSLLRKDL